MDLTKFWATSGRFPSGPRGRWHHVLTTATLTGERTERHNQQVALRYEDVIFSGVSSSRARCGARNGIMETVSLVFQPETLCLRMGGLQVPRSAGWAPDCVARVLLWGDTRSSASAEIARVGAHYTVEGHSRSLISIPIESWRKTS